MPDNLSLFTKVLIYLSTLSGLPAVMVGRNKRSAIWLYVLLSFIFDVNGTVLRIMNIPRFWASNLFFLVEFLCFSCYFIGAICPQKYKKVAYYLTGAMVLYFVIHTSMKSIWHTNFVDGAILYGIYIFYCLCGLAKVIQEIEYVMIERNPTFIFCVAILLYASGSFIILLFENKLLYLENGLILSLWLYVRNPLNIFKNLLIAYGFILMNKNKWVRSS